MNHISQFNVIKKAAYRKVKIADSKEPENTVEENIIHGIEQQLEIQIITRLVPEATEQILLVVVRYEHNRRHDLVEKVARALHHQIVLRGQIELGVEQN